MHVAFFNKLPNCRSCYVSESEGEEPTEAHVTLPQNVRGRGNAKSSQSAIKLVEVKLLSY